MALRPRDRRFVAALVVMTCGAASFAQTAAGAASTPALPSLRVGVGVAPIVGYSGRTFFLHQAHRLDHGGWINIDAAPGLQLSELFTLELAVSLLVPVQDAYGFPGTRVGVAPTVRFDADWFYARAGVQFMFGEGVKYAGLLALGANVWKLYVGVVGLVTSDFLGGVGLEVGVHFDQLLPFLGPDEGRGSGGAHEP